MLKQVALLQVMKQISCIPWLCRNMCSTSFAVHTTLFRVGLQKTKIPPHHPSFWAQQCHPLHLGLFLPSCLPREQSFFFNMAAAAQTNTPRLAAGMALFQPRDWFSAAQLSLSLAICIVCQNMNECNLSKNISTMFHITIEEKLFLDSYRYIAQAYLICKSLCIKASAKCININTT